MCRCPQSARAHYLRAAPYARPTNEAVAAINSQCDWREQVERRRDVDLMTDPPDPSRTIRIFNRDVLPCLVKDETVGKTFLAKARKDRAPPSRKPSCSEWFRCLTPNARTEHPPSRSI